MFRRHGAGGDVVFDVFGQTGEQKLIAAGKTARRRGLHRDRFPFGRTLIAGIQSDAGRLHADGDCGNQLVGVAAHDGVARGDTKVVERGFAGVRAGPEQRCAVTEKAGACRNHPDKRCKGADANTG